MGDTVKRFNWFEGLEYTALILDISSAVPLSRTIDLFAVISIWQITDAYRFWFFNC